MSHITQWKKGTHKFLIFCTGFVQKHNKTKAGIKPKLLFAQYQKKLCQIIPQKKKNSNVIELGMLVYVVMSLPDLLQCDFFLWAHMKKMAYLQKCRQRYCSD